MSKISIVGATLLAAAVLCAAPVSLHQSKDGLSLSRTRRKPMGETAFRRKRGWCE